MKEINIFCDQGTLSGRLGTLLIEQDVKNVLVSNDVYHLRRSLINKDKYVSLHHVRFIVPKARASALYDILKESSINGPVEHQFTLFMTPVDCHYMPR